MASANSVGRCRGAMRMAHGRSGGLPEELLIEVVAPPAYGLAQGETRSGRVGEGERVYATVPAEEEQA